MSWLENDTQEIYWITGKPGAGKSTLMKFLTNHHSVKRHLSNWIGSSPVIVATFYSWNAGTELQKSQSGLLRTLLYQCFSQRHSLVAKVCPKRWAWGQMLDDLPTPKLFTKFVWSSWPWFELREAFCAVASRAGHEYRLVLLIDGLDEFSDGHADIVKLLKDLSELPGVKICASSRPWNVFNDAFQRNPSLMVQDLTRDDIVRYIKGHFEPEPAFREFRALEPDEAAGLLRDIASRADGVFLWVAVVVRTLVEKMVQWDKLADLRLTLNQLPQDVEDLFEAIKRRISPEHAAQFSRYFLLLLESLRTPCLLRASALTFLLADEDEDSSIHRTVLATRESRQSGVDVIRRRLRSRTLGLLEISPNDTVGFLHRSVLEWATRDSHFAAIKRDAPAGFNPNLELLKARTTELITIFPEEASRPMSELAAEAKFEDIAQETAREVRFRDLIAICLRHAAYAGCAPGDDARIVRLLEKLESHWYKTISAGKLDLCWGYLVLMGISFRHAGDVRMSEGTFVRLAAKFAVRPYVVAKVDSAPLHDLLIGVVFSHVDFALDDGVLLTATSVQRTTPEILALWLTRLG